MALSSRTKKEKMSQLYDNYCCPMLGTPTIEQLLRQKRACAKYHIDISQTKGLVRVHTEGRTKKHRLFMLQTS